MYDQNAANCLIKLHGNYENQRICREKPPVTNQNAGATHKNGKRDPIDEQQRKKRKNKREKERRQEISEQFKTLAYTLNLPDKERTEKTLILKRANEEILILRNEIQKRARHDMDLEAMRVGGGQSWLLEPDNLQNVNAQKNAYERLRQVSTAQQPITASRISHFAQNQPSLRKGHFTSNHRVRLSEDSSMNAHQDRHQDHQNDSDPSHPNTLYHNTIIINSHHHHPRSDDRASRNDRVFHSVRPFYHASSSATESQLSSSTTSQNLKEESDVNNPNEKLDQQELLKDVKIFGDSRENSNVPDGPPPRVRPLDSALVSNPYAPVPEHRDQREIGSAASDDMHYFNAPCPSTVEGDENNDPDEARNHHSSTDDQIVFNTRRKIYNRFQKRRNLVQQQPQPQQEHSSVQPPEQAVYTPHQISQLNRVRISPPEPNNRRRARPSSLPSPPPPPKRLIILADTSMESQEKKSTTKILP